MITKKKDYTMAEITENEENQDETLPEGNEGTELDSEVGGTVGTAGTTGSNVVVEDDDGEIDGYDPENFETDAAITKQYCQGSFRMMTSPEFTQDKNYSDEYLRSKGLFKGDINAESESE